MVKWESASQRKPLDSSKTFQHHPQEGERLLEYLSRHCFTLLGRFSVHKKSWKTEKQKVYKKQKQTCAVFPIAIGRENCFAYKIFAYYAT